jgi:hypothetical protein
MIGSRGDKEATPDLKQSFGEWQVYSHESYRFQLQYPAGWTVRTVIEPDLLALADPQHVYYFEGSETHPIEVSLYENVGSWTTKTLAASRYSLPYSPDESAYREIYYRDGREVIAVRNAVFPHFEVVLPNVIIRISCMVGDRDVAIIAQSIASTVAPH